MNILKNQLIAQFLVISTLTFAVGIAENIFAQSATLSPSNEINDQTDDLLRYSIGIPNCESARRNIEVMIEEIEKPADTSIIAIIRLGKSEPSGFYSPRQLLLDEILKRRYKNLGGKHIVAESNRTTADNGRIEFYVQGKLYMIYETKRNSKRICTN